MALNGSISQCSDGAGELNLEGSPDDERSSVHESPNLVVHLTENNNPDFR